MSSAAFLEFAREARPLVDSALDAYSRFGSGCPEQLERAIRHGLLAPGKRLRPLLVLMAARACGCPIEAALPAACAVEMVHAYSLIHDDLPAMDDDDLRRGLPSCHAAFGEATAILAGDALLARAFEVLAADARPAEAAARCCAELARAAGAAALVGGQADDLAAEFANWGLAELEGIHRRKTGALFRACLRLGGLTAGAGEWQLCALDDYARPMGLAFQIIDDLLDLEGDEAALGKRAGKDAQRGKLTFPGLLGAAASRRRAEELVAQARAALTCFPQQAAPLEALAQYILERKQ